MIPKCRWLNYKVFDFCSERRAVESQSWQGIASSENRTAPVSREVSCRLSFERNWCNKLDNGWLNLLGWLKGSRWQAATTANYYGELADIFLKEGSTTMFVTHSLPRRRFLPLMLCIAGVQALRGRALYCPQKGSGYD